MEAGQQLFEARQQRGLTLDDISRSTKIPISLLRAIERNDAARLPQEFFTRAFVRAYAKEVGVDADALVGSIEVSEVDEVPMERLATAPIDDRPSSRSFVAVVALCATCAVYSGVALKTAGPATPQVLPPSAAHPLNANPVAAVAPPPCVAVPPSPTTVRANHRSATSASTEQVVTAGTATTPNVKHVTVEDQPVIAPVDELPSTTSDPMNVPVDRNQTPTSAPAEQL